MATEDIKRLRDKGKVVGFLLIDHGKVDFVKHVPLYRSTYSPLEPIQWDSFDHSFKQGDEWFFEGDEVEVRDSVQCVCLIGILCRGDFEWYISN